MATLSLLDRDPHSHIHHSPSLRSHLALGGFGPAHSEVGFSATDSVYDEDLDTIRSRAQEGGAVSLSVDDRLESAYTSNGQGKSAVC
ncbi:hypothetical protein VKT23_013911 [Stygiomarasmius scandens]|uniref:Uncharacterized protein n=1 Tax=Marasmiellus scandens TaxID=2682957 RepID=A0ABR1J3F5_9AGAR